LKAGWQRARIEPCLTAMFYIPMGLVFFLAMWGLVALLWAFIQIGILQSAFQSMGVSSRYMLALLLLCLVGSYVNIPVAQWPGHVERSGQIVDFYGVQYVVPVLINSPGTILAVNLGGAVIPVILSFYLIAKHGIPGRSVLAVGLVAGMVHVMARAVPGVGIAVPIFIPPLITALVALILSARNPAPLAYIAGSLGTLIGADLLNLDKVRGMGAPVASIGGAGKFDGIFLNGIVAVLLAGFLGGVRAPAQPACVESDL
jgi:uncharacterized membrane protein